MPPRLSKRQQREQEEIAALSNNNITNETVSEKDDTEASINDASGEVKGPSKAGFSLVSPFGVIEIIQTMFLYPHVPKPALELRHPIISVILP